MIYGFNLQPFENQMLPALLGNYNGNPDDDLITKGQTTSLPTTATPQEIFDFGNSCESISPMSRSPLTGDQPLFPLHSFAVKRVSTGNQRVDFFYSILTPGAIDCADSLFVYPAGKSCSNYQDPSFVPIFVVDFAGDAAAEADAESVCSAAITDYVQEICILDYFVTGSQSFAQATLEAANKAEQNRLAASSC